MDASAMLSRQGHRLLQVGVSLFLFTSFEGFAIPYFAASRLGLSAHTLGALQGVLLLALGLMWPRLDLGTTTSRSAFWLLIYSAFAILAAYVMAAAWGAGNETMRLAAGTARGSAFQEAVIKDVAYSSAPTGITSFALILWVARWRWSAKGWLSARTSKALGVQTKSEPLSELLRNKVSEILRNFQNEKHVPSPCSESFFCCKIQANGKEEIPWTQFVSTI